MSVYVCVYWQTGIWRQLQQYIINKWGGSVPIKSKYKDMVCWGEQLRVCHSDFVCVGACTCHSHFAGHWLHPCCSRTEVSRSQPSPQPASVARSVPAEGSIKKEEEWVIFWYTMNCFETPSHCPMELYYPQAKSNDWPDLTVLNRTILRGVVTYCLTFW